MRCQQLGRGSSAYGRGPIVGSLNKPPIDPRVGLMSNRKTTDPSETGKKVKFQVALCKIVRVWRMD